jgi:hypothetical protein
MVTPPTKPKAVHVYRGTVTGNLSVYEKRLPKRELGYREYLGEYVPRGDVIRERYQVRDWRGFAYGSFPTRARAVRSKRVAKARPVAPSATC